MVTQACIYSFRTLYEKRKILQERGIFWLYDGEVQLYAGGYKVEECGYMPDERGYTLIIWCNDKSGHYVCLAVHQKCIALFISDNISITPVLCVADMLIMLGSWQVLDMIIMMM